MVQPNLIAIDRAVVEINGGCNFKCAMCPQADPGRHKGFLRKLSLIEFEDIIAQCAEHGTRIVNLDGSGEATLNRNLARYIEIVNKYGMQSYIFSNGYNMRGQFMEDCVDAGLSYFRFSIIGYDDETYSKWMKGPGNLRDTMTNLLRMHLYAKDKDCTVAAYHLILDNDNIDYETAMYRDLTDLRGIPMEVWKMHNWSGVYDPEYGRDGKVKTCGRPFSPDIVIRAGGLDGKYGAVHPCCQVLGQDENAVLGHLQDNTIQEVWDGPEYAKLREQHTTGDYPDFCKGCDFLIDDPEVLVYTNYERDLYKMVGTEFSLEDYR